ncbi:MAG: hypothetical protein JO297_09285 [Nitrososphaeraceae archaeon]|nr:hypothetical protein [Nitrososphaeraceae archaeon]
MSIENIDQYIKELTAIKEYDNLKQYLAQIEKEIQNLKNTLATRDKELVNTGHELKKWKAYAIRLNEIKMIFDNNKNITTLAEAVKVFLNAKRQQIERKATEKFQELKKNWEEFDKPLEFQSYYNEKIEQKVKEIEDKIRTNVFQLLAVQEWKINCNNCGLGHTIKFNAKDLSILLQYGFIDIECNGNNSYPRLPEVPSIPSTTSENIFEQQKPRYDHTTRITLHSLIQNYLQ